MYMSDGADFMYEIIGLMNIWEERHGILSWDRYRCF